MLKSKLVESPRVERYPRPLPLSDMSLSSFATEGAGQRHLLIKLKIGLDLKGLFWQKDYTTATATGLLISRLLKQSALLQSAAYLTSSLSEVMQAYRLAVFNVLAGNRDDYSKNFAFLHDEFKGRYTLAPAYDFTYAPLIPEHHMTCFGNGRPAEDDLLRLAE